MKTLATLIALTALLVGCSDNEVMNVVMDSMQPSDEESNVQLTLTDTYDEIRGGARLILAYDAQSNSFKGTVENTTNQTLTRVRVEVHLSNGIELGPTTPVDMQAGQIIDVELKATDVSFDKWAAHAEVGGSGEGNEAGEHANEASGEGNEAGEHANEASGEHG